MGIEPKTFLSWNLCSISNDLAIQKSIYNVIVLFRTHMIFVVNNIPGIGSHFTGDVVMILCRLMNKICPTIQNRIASFGLFLVKVQLRSTAHPKLTQLGF